LVVLGSLTLVGVFEIFFSFFQVEGGKTAPGGGGGTPRKTGWGCTVRFPKPLPYLLPKSAIFPTLFMT